MMLVQKQQQQQQQSGLAQMEVAPIPIPMFLNGMDGMGVLFGCEHPWGLASGKHAHLPKIAARESQV